MLCFTFSFFFINNPYLVPFYIFYSVVTQSLFFFLRSKTIDFVRRRRCYPTCTQLSWCLLLLLYHFVVYHIFCAYPAKQAFQSEEKMCTKLREKFIRFWFFWRQIGWEQRREGGKETFPTLPYPTPTRTFTFRGQLVSCCCCCCFCLFFFFLCQKLKTWSLFALYSLEMLSTLSLTVICLLLVFEGCPSKPLYQSWFTTPFAKMTGVVSTIILWAQERRFLSCPVQTLLYSALGKCQLRSCHRALDFCLNCLCQPSWRPFSSLPLIPSSIVLYASESRFRCRLRWARSSFGRRPCLVLASLAGHYISL